MIQLDFVMSLQHTDIVKGLPFQQLLRRQRERQKSNRFNKQSYKFASASQFLVQPLPSLHYYVVKLSRLLMEDVHTKLRLSFPFSELGRGPDN